MKFQIMLPDQTVPCPGADIIIYDIGITMTLDDDVAEGPAEKIREAAFDAGMEKLEELVAWVEGQGYLVEQVLDEQDGGEVAAWEEADAILDAAVEECERDTAIEAAMLKAAKSEMARLKKNRETAGSIKSSRRRAKGKVSLKVLAATVKLGATAGADLKAWVDLVKNLTKLAKLFKKHHTKAVKLVGQLQTHVEELQTTLKKLEKLRQPGRRRLLTLDGIRPPTCAGTGGLPG